MNRTTLLIASVLLLTQCGGETDSSVFQGASQLVVQSPQTCKRFLLSFGENDDVFQFGVNEDTPGLNNKRVFAAIFKERPQVQEGRIINPQDALWVWHSGMRSNADAVGGKLRFTDGTATLDDGTPATLESCRFDDSCQALAARFDRATSRTYYFAVWAWNDEREISYFSDQEAAFCFTADESQKDHDCPATCLTD
jgi:hypothetical protein